MARHSGLPFFALVAFTFLACGSTINVGKAGEGADGGAAGTPGAAPPGTLACKDNGAGGARNCTCAVAATKIGACSPQSLGRPGHCCATIDGTGATTQCECASDPTTCMSYTTSSSGPFCECTTVEQGFNGTEIAECAKPAGGHCCRSQGNASCGCSMQACTGAGDEVDSCSPTNAILRCLSPAIAVTSCQ